MSEFKEMCCFCLNVLSGPLTDIFTKSENSLSNFHKISASLFQLANILNENDGYKYVLCNECCDTIEMVYRFNQTCLHNIEIYLSEKEHISVVTEQEQSSILVKTEDCKEKIFVKTEIVSDSVSQPELTEHLSAYGNIPEVVLIKEEAKDVSDSVEIYSVDEEKRRKNRRKNVKPLRINQQTKDERDSSVEEENSGDAAAKNVDKLEKSKREGQITIKVKSLNDDRVYVCEICGKSFKQKGNLMSHLLVHSGLKPFICDICGNRFASKINLKSHINIHTGQKPYKCSTCNSEFRDRSTYSQHKKIHSGIKPYACDQCDRCFTKKYLLTEHKRIHSGEKPYECEVCKRTFTQKSILLRHKRLHTGEKPFSCEICNNSFTQKISLDQHKLKYHQS